PDQIARIQALHPFLKNLTLPAHSYPGQEQAIATVGSWSLILARPGLPEEVAYRFARALQRAQSAFVKRLAQARETMPENTIAAAPGPHMLHPGVVRYFREIKLMR
ncbi:MAG: TAXI family TRAP transporter solute-binding subunit, partial [Burkholderiales bacterium]